MRARLRRTILHSHGRPREGTNVRTRGAPLASETALPPGSKRLTIVQLTAPPRSHTAQFAEAVREGLLSHPKTLPWQYFYDERGSQLFEEICQVPEYYLTRTEDA